jgi:uncharacterized protein (TIGR02611 family)
MLEKLKRRLIAFAHGEPGSRFEDRYYRVHATKRHFLHKAFFVGMGVFVMAAGVFFLPAPGPGMVIIAIGAAMVAQESLAMARFMDRMEVRGRRWFIQLRAWWRARRSSQRFLLLAAALSCVAAVMYAGFLLVL